MMFRDRIEIWNPGQLPMGWTTDTLKKVHTSIPRNPLLAEPMYLMGYIERLGTGTMDMIRIAKDAKLTEPRFIQEDDFRVIISRPVFGGEVSGEVLGTVGRSKCYVHLPLRADNSYPKKINFFLSFPNNN
jgi:predicted HTH transcriptional regulator